MAECSRCHSDDVDERYAGPASICPPCVRAERVNQGLTASIYDDPEAVAFLADLARRAARRAS